MGQLSDMMNKDFDRRLALAEELGLDVHGEEMMTIQLKARMRQPLNDPDDVPEYKAEDKPVKG